MTRFDKAIAPIVVTAILGGLSLVGITEGMTVGEAVTYGVSTALAVFLVPNKA